MDSKDSPLNAIERDAKVERERMNAIQAFDPFSYHRSNQKSVTICSITIVPD